jgi:hypothetical protein
MRIWTGSGLAMAIILIGTCASSHGQEPSAFGPGARVLLDAHNAYPYDGRFGDRLKRALGTGVPLAIEQDLVWCAGTGGAFDVFVAHDTVCRGDEPTLRHHFFDQVRPVIEEALARTPKEQWPVVTLNLDFKMDPPELHRAVWDLLKEHDAWLTTAPRLADAGTPAPLTVGPLLVLTGEADEQQLSFHDRVPVGERLRLFGAAHNAPPLPGATAGALPVPMPASNYRRWWNHPWTVVEPEGQRAAGEWTADDNARLTRVVTAAHDANLWVRFYTLDGVSDADGDAQGWAPSYNFGALSGAQARWRAAIAARADFVATDQYEELASLLHARAQQP